MQRQVRGQAPYSAASQMILCRHPKPWPSSGAWPWIEIAV